MLRFAQEVEDFNALFPDEASCVEAVMELKWRHGFRCDECGHDAAYRISTRKLPLFECIRCGHQSSLTSGTFLHKSRTPLRKWLSAMYSVTQFEAGINAVELSKQLAVTYKTAFSMLRKIRKCIASMDSDVLLEGRVQGKHALYMHKLNPRRDRVSTGQSAVVARSVSEDSGSSYYKFKLLERTKPIAVPLNVKEREAFEEQYCGDEVGNVEWDARYQAKWRHDCLLEAALPSVEERDSDKISIGLATIARKAFQWITDKFQGVGPKYTSLYFDEFCYRLNGLAGRRGGVEMLSSLLGNMTSCGRLKTVMASATQNVG